MKITINTSGSLKSRLKYLIVGCIAVPIILIPLIFFVALIPIMGFLFPTYFENKEKKIKNND